MAVIKISEVQKQIYYVKDNFFNYNSHIILFGADGNIKLLNEEIQQILFVDESMIRDYQAIHQNWFERGKQRIIKTFGKHCGVKLVGYLNYETGEIYCEEHES